MKGYTMKPYKKNFESMMEMLNENSAFSNLDKLSMQIAYEWGWRDRDMQQRYHELEMSQNLIKEMTEQLQEHKDSEMESEQSETE